MFKKIAILAMLMLSIAILVGCGRTQAEPDDYQDLVQAQEAHPIETGTIHPAEDIWVIRFEGEYIPASDLMLFFGAFGVLSGEPERSDLAIEALVDALVIIDRANRSGLGLTAAEKDSMALEMSFQRQMIPEELAITDERMAELFSVHNILRDRLFDYYVPEYVPDMDEVTALFDNYMESSGDFHAQTEAMYLFIQNSDELAEVQARLGSVPFRELVAEYYEEDIEDVPVYNAAELANGLIIDLAMDFLDAFAIIALEEGEIHVAELGDTGAYVMVYMYSRLPLDMDELKEAFMDSLIWSRRTANFQNLLLEWLDAAEYTINREAVDEILQGL